MKTVFLAVTTDKRDDLPFFNSEPLFACTTRKKCENLLSVLPAAPDGLTRDIIEIKLY